ncbi:MAG: DNA-3-methyladenine glycosylase 2 family protein [Acidobacteriota bacterium]
MRRLDDETLQVGIDVLCRQDRRLAALVKTHGRPPLWARPTGYATLLQVVLEQQVSLDSAKAIYERLRKELRKVTPTTVLPLGVDGLRERGFTRQKAGYVITMAQRIESGELSLRKIALADDAKAAELLLAEKGIGPWTAAIYLLMALCRPDIWPRGDIALEIQLQALHGLKKRPVKDETDALAEEWRPWRSVAARILWQAYLSERGRA